MVYLKLANRAHSLRQGVWNTYLPAAQLRTNLPLGGQQQVVFISSNDADASATVAAVATQLGFAPIELGRLDQGGLPLHAVDGEAGGLLFQNVEKLIGKL
jgi:predicted dinucleotide-binding enzyme